MRTAPERLIITDDIPAHFVAEMLFNPGTVNSVFSEEDAVVAAEAKSLRSPHPKQSRSRTYPRRVGDQ